MTAQVRVRHHALALTDWRTYVPLTAVCRDAKNGIFKLIGSITQVFAYPCVASVWLQVEVVMIYEQLCIHLQFHR